MDINDDHEDDGDDDNDSDSGENIKDQFSKIFLKIRSTNAGQLMIRGTGSAAGNTTQYRCEINR